MLIPICTWTSIITEREEETGRKKGEKKGSIFKNKLYPPAIYSRRQTIDEIIVVTLTTARNAASCILAELARFAHFMQA